jgi:curved DNA-binding protein CbpA
MAQPKKTLYQILGVTPDASSIDIGLAHEKRTAELEKLVPPDATATAGGTPALRGGQQWSAA